MPPHHLAYSNMLDDSLDNNYNSILCSPINYYTCYIMFTNQLSLTSSCQVYLVTKVDYWRILSIGVEFILAFSVLVKASLLPMFEGDVVQTLGKVLSFITFI
uniref:Uncharacterized protein n=1 Tax=Cacopsylla melanoneura TaxID=428564 RepID=A0A8D8ZDA0_9HEMI